MTDTQPGLLHHRDFRLLWTGESVSDFGTAVTGVVLPLIAVLDLDARPIQVGVLSALQWLPWLLVGLPAGVWVDRSRRRPLMIGCDLVRAVLLVSVPVAAAFGVLTMNQLFAAAFGVGLATVLFQVAYQAYLPTLVEADQLAEGNAKLQGTQAVANVVGPGIGGVLAQLLQAPYALIADAASYVVSAAALVKVQVREEDLGPIENRSLRDEIGEGARFVRADPILRVMTIAPALGNFFFVGFEAVVVVFLVRTLHLPASEVGLLLSAVGVGAVLGAVSARRIGKTIGTSRAIWVSMLVSSPFGLLIPLTHRGVAVAFFVIGNVVLLAGILVYNVTISSFRQVYCPPRILGRVVATMRFVLFGTLPLGALTGGLLANSFSPRTALWLLLAGNIVPSFILVASPLRHFRDLPARPA